MMGFKKVDGNGFEGRGEKWNKIATAVIPPRPSSSRLALKKGFLNQKERWRDDALKNHLKGEREVSA